MPTANDSMSRNRFAIKRLMLSSLCLATLCCLIGCPSSKPKPNLAEAAAEPEVSEYPLRVWIAADVTDVSRIERQWLAGSDQPIDIRILTTEELLENATCACDILLFPSRLLGELVHRKWVVRLPEAVLEVDTALEGEIAVSPPAALAQAQYGGVEYALPLGCSLPVVIASDSLYKQVPSLPTSWSQLCSRLETNGPLELPPEEAIDREALVDRFLFIVGSLTDRNPNYGLLFELQTMTPRITQPEFVEATNVLKSLGSQRGGAAAVVGSHDVAWEFATQPEGTALAIASPALLSQGDMSVKSGKRLTIQTKGDVKNWNVGGGLLAALASDCRQSSLSVGMLKWMRLKKTRDSMAAVVAGVEPTSPESGADSLSWQVRTQLGDIFNNANLPQEPRLSAAQHYRDVLAGELLNILTEQKTAEEALADAAKAWSSISPDSQFDVQADYEKSLGLAL